MIPDFQKIMRPLLEFASDGQVHSLHEAIDSLSEKFELTNEELEERIPSGKQTKFNNRVSWAKTHLKKAMLLDSPKRGYLQITESRAQRT